MLKKKFFFLKKIKIITPKKQTTKSLTQKIFKKKERNLYIKIK